MVNAIKLQTLEDLLIHALRVEKGDSTWDDADYSTLDLRIPVVVKGPGRDRRIDYRAAKFIQSLQTSINKAYKSFDAKDVKKIPKLLVEAKDGSNALIPDFTAVAIEGIKKMPPKLIFAFLITAIIAPTGYLSFAKWQDAKTQQELVKTFERMHEDALASGRDIKKPIREYVEQMDEHEAISISGGSYIPKEEASKILKKPPVDDKTYYVWADGNYNLLGLDLSQKVPALKLSQGGKTITALLERLDNKTRKNLIEKIDKRLSLKQVPFPIDLQLEVYFSGNKVSHSVVIAIDKPREEKKSFPLTSIPAEIPDSERIIPGL